jgi:hypothetical protein
LDVRKKPLRTMLIGVKNKLMTRNHERMIVEKLLGGISLLTSLGSLN